jgi:chorismate dehydratase
MTAARSARIRVGAVSYLNTKPLIWQLEQLAPQVLLVLDYPSRLADRLAAGTLDVALIPSIELFHDPGYSIVSDACIACRGPVMSVKLFSRVPLEQIRTLALDEGSRTSVALVQILLHERFGLRPQLEPLPLGKSTNDTSADAVLLIGDRAMQAPGEPFAAVWDLGEQWRLWSGLPFVFAMWVARAGADLQGVEEALAEARDRGLAHLHEKLHRWDSPSGNAWPTYVTTSTSTSAPASSRVSNCSTAAPANWAWRLRVWSLDSMLAKRLDKPVAWAGRTVRIATGPDPT